MHDQGSTANPYIADIICKAADKLGISLDVFDTYTRKGKVFHVQNTEEARDSRAQVIAEARTMRTPFGNLPSLMELADALGTCHNSICRMRDRIAKPKQGSGTPQYPAKRVPRQKQAAQADGHPHEVCSNADCPSP